MNSRMENGSLVFVAGARTARASVLRVPGPDGRGAYVGELNIQEGPTETTRPRENADAAHRDLAAAIGRHGFSVLPLVLTPILVYSEGWVPGELALQRGYDPAMDPASDLRRLYARFIGLLWANLPKGWDVSLVRATRSELVVEFDSDSFPTRATKSTYSRALIERWDKMGRLAELANPPADG